MLHKMRIQCVRPVSRIHSTRVTYPRGRVPVIRWAWLFLWAGQRPFASGLSDYGRYSLTFVWIDNFIRVHCGICVFGSLGWKLECPIGFWHPSFSNTSNPEVSYRMRCTNSTWGSNKYSGPMIFLRCQAMALLTNAWQACLPPSGGLSSESFIQRNVFRNNLLHRSGVHHHRNHIWSGFTL